MRRYVLVVLTCSLLVSFLVLTGMSVSGIPNSRVNVLGALFLEISANGRCTRQLVYIASEARSLILSEKALKDLGVIPENFPCAGTFGPTHGPPAQQQARGESHSLAEVSEVKPAGAEIDPRPKSSCGCLLRSEVPPLPTEIPCDNPEACREKLHKWILNYYAASAFNICPHQVTPTLTGPDMVITVKPGAVPVACHSKIPIPHHWKKKVKGLIDKNCRSGVVTPVKAGTPTPWCSKLLTTAKDSGEPPLVLDLHPLNSVSQR